MPIDVSNEKADRNVKSQFTKEADMAFDEFCRIYLNSSNGFLTETTLKATQEQINQSKQADVQELVLVEEKTVQKNIKLSPEKMKIAANINPIGCKSNRISVLLEKYPYEKTNSQTFSQKEFRHNEIIKPKQTADSIKKAENTSLETMKCENENQNNQSKEKIEKSTKNQVEFRLVKNKYETLKNFDYLLAHIESERKLKKKSNITRNTYSSSNSLIKDFLSNNVAITRSVNTQAIPKTALKESKDLILAKNQEKTEIKTQADSSITKSETSQTNENKPGYLSNKENLTLKESRDLNSTKETQNQLGEKNKTTVEQVCNYLDLINDKTLIEDYEILSKLSTYYPFLDIPKKKKFCDEFYAKHLPKHTKEKLYIMNPNKENEDIRNLCDRISPYIVTRTQPQQQLTRSHTADEKPTYSLGLKMSVCGMRKDAKLPIPKANYFMNKGNFGDDAGFLAENNFGEAIGIADGATGNSIFGYDPGDFSRQLMKSCSEIFMNQTQFLSAKQLLMNAYENVQKTNCYGSCTACVFTFDHRSSQMTAVNIGDSGYCLIRDGKIIEKSEPTRLSRDCPKQLDSYPWKEESRRRGVSYTELLSNDTQCETIKVLKDDIIIVSSDGLFDNLTFDEIEQINSRSKSIMDMAENLVNQSVKFYRKPDDVLVIVAKVVENKESSIQQFFSNQTKNQKK